MPTATGVRIPTPAQMLAQMAIVESQWLTVVQERGVRLVGCHIPDARHTMAKSRRSARSVR
jgi:hypothetical protein